MMGTLRGRKKLNPEDRHDRIVKARYTPQELAGLDARRGRMSRGAYVRLASIDRIPPAIPPCNLQAHADLGRALGNLATLATAMRGGEYADLQACRDAVADLRNTIISARKLAINDESEDE